MITQSTEWFQHTLRADNSKMLSLFNFFLCFISFFLNSFNISHLYQASVGVGHDIWNSLNYETKVMLILSQFLLICNCHYKSTMKNKKKLLLLITFALVGEIIFFSFFLFVSENKQKNFSLYKFHFFNFISHSNSRMMSQKSCNILVTWSTICQFQMHLLRFWWWWPTLDCEIPSSADALWRAHFGSSRSFCWNW